MYVARRPVSRPPSPSCWKGERGRSLSLAGPHIRACIASPTPQTNALQPPDRRRTSTDSADQLLEWFEARGRFSAHGRHPRGSEVPAATAIQFLLVLSSATPASRRSRVLSTAADASLPPHQPGAGLRGPAGRSSPGTVRPTGSDAHLLSQTSSRLATTIGSARAGGSIAHCVVLQRTRCLSAVGDVSVIG